MSKQALSRREFLKIAGASAATAVVGASLGPLGASRAAARALRQEAVEITFMGWGGVEEDEGVRAAIEVFEQEQDAVRVTWLHTPDNYPETLLANVAAGTPPDTAFMASESFRTYVHDGLTLDITDYVENDELLGQEDYFIQPQERERCTDENGRWHGIGSCWVAPHIYYNGAIFEEAGITPPGFKDDEIWDWDHFLDVARQLTVDVNGKHPGEDGFDFNNVGRYGVDWPRWWIPLHAAVASNGGTWTDEKGQLLTFDTPEAVEAIQRVADLVYLHQVSPETTAFESLGMSNTQMLETGRLAMAIDGSWALAWMYKIEAPLGVGALPKMVEPATDMQAHLHGIIAMTQHPDEAWQWIRFLATPFYQTQFLKMGLWLPSQTALLTEEGLETWLTEGVHPANFRDFVVEYLPKYGKTIVLPAGWLEAAAFIDPAIEAVANGSARAVDAIPEAVAQANALLLEEYVNA